MNFLLLITKFIKSGDPKQTIKTYGAAGLFV